MQQATHPSSHSPTHPYYSRIYSRTPLFRLQYQTGTLLLACCLLESAKDMLDCICLRDLGNELVASKSMGDIASE